MIVRAGEIGGSESSAVESVQDGGAAPAASPSPVEWIQQARWRPRLAGVLVRATTGTDSDVALEHWPRLFLNCPNWQQIADQLTRGSRPAIDQDAYRLACTAASVAGASGWCPRERAFWYCLTEPAPQDDEPLETWPFLSPTIRCVKTAQFLQQPDADLRRLVTTYPEIDWASLVLDCQPSWHASQPPDHHDWSAIAQRQAKQEACIVQDALLAATTAATIEEWLLQVASLMQRLTAQPVGIWLDAPTKNREITGVGAVADSTGQPWLVAMDRAEFENEKLPGSCRSSETVAHRESYYGRIYLGSNALLDRLRPWWEVMAAGAALQVNRSRRYAELVRRKAVYQLQQRSGWERYEERMRGLMTEFSAGAAHEINNPLAAISGKAQWLLNHETEPQKRQALAKINEQVARIHEMIRDLHFVGRPSFAPKAKIRVADALRRGLSLAITAGRRANISVQDCPAEAILFGNEAEIARLIAELLRNAVEAGGENCRVQVHVSLVDEGRSVRLAVLDNGPGFSREDAEHVFDPFYSGREAGRGLGMGLCVVKRIVDDHEGEIRIGLGKPTTVSVTLPCHRGED